MLVRDVSRGFSLAQILCTGQVQWLTPVIIATQEAAIGNMVVPGQPKQNICKTPSQTVAGHSGAHFHPQPHREAQIEGSQSRPAWA
jgi:hypothetical protein